MAQGLLTKRTKIEKKIKISSINTKLFLFIFVLFVVAISVIVYIYNDANNTEQQINTKEQRFEQLVKKIKTEELSNSEWAEVCELLAELKNIYITDCSDCRHYIKALLGGKHSPHLKMYSKRTVKEVEKGIRSYQKQIELHENKIKNPERFIPEWNDLDPRQREALVSKKWNEDIKRLKEQKEILECILKN